MDGNGNGMPRASVAISRRAAFDGGSGASTPAQARRLTASPGIAARPAGSSESTEGYIGRHGILHTAKIAVLTFGMARMPDLHYGIACAATVSEPGSLWLMDTILLSGWKLRRQAGGGMADS